MIDLYTVGSEAIRLFWGPVLVWSVCAALWIMASRLLPQSYPQLRLDGAVAIILGLPLAFLLSWSLPDSVGTTLTTVLPEPTASANLVAAPDVAVYPAAAAPAWTWVEAAGLLSLVLAASSLIGLLSLLVSWVRLHRLVGRALPVASLARRVRISSETHVPFSCGLVRPVIILPAHLDRDDWDMVLRHEGIHIDHGDVWRTWLAALTRAVFVFHPAAHALYRDVNLYAEICCDHRVLQCAPLSSRRYAQLLIRNTPAHRPTAPALALASSSSQLKKRINAMKSPTQKILSRTPMALWVLVISVSVGLLAGCSDMEVAPTQPDVSNEAYDLIMELPAAKSGVDAEVFSVVEESPIMIGGRQELQSRITYPTQARDAGISGRVLVRLVVDENGKVQRPEVLRGIGGGADEEALRAIQTMTFVPGVQRGQRVKVQMVIPIIFSLDGSSASPSSAQADAREVIEASQVAVVSE